MIEKRGKHRIVAVGSIAKSRGAGTEELRRERWRAENLSRTGAIGRGALPGSRRAAGMTCKNASRATHRWAGFASADLRNVQCWWALAQGLERNRAVLGPVTKPSLKVRVLSQHQKPHGDRIWPMFSPSNGYLVTLF